MIKRLIAAFLTLFIFSPAGDAEAYAPLNKDSMLTSFTVISDVHLEGNNSEKHQMTGEAIVDISGAEVLSKALVMLGDNTMNGQTMEQSMLYGLLRKYNKVENVLMAAGNHELCPSKYNNGDAEKLKKRFVDYNNAFLDNKIENTYHYSVIDGYYYIVLGSEGDAGVQQLISDSQLQWLKGVLEQAKSSGKPVFLFNHNPSENAFTDVWPEGHIGEKNDELMAILADYGEKIFFFTGHLHMGIFEDGRNVVEKDNISFISVPSFGSVNDVGDADVQDTGLGMQVEVYPENIPIRVRDFANHQWTEYQYDLKY